MDQAARFNPLHHHPPPPSQSFTPQSQDSTTSSSTLPPQSMSGNPPQIFGNHSADGSYIPPAVPPGTLFNEDSFSYGFDELQDYGDAKRRRIARACDMCRKKKIKCDAKLPKCTHCENYKTECIFTHIEKKRAAPKGAKYIEGLENRLGRMEHLLRLSGLLGEEDEDGATDLGALEQRLAKQVGSRNASPSHGSEALSPTESQKSDRRKHTPRESSVTSPKSTGASPDTQSSHGDPKTRLDEKKKAEKSKDVDDLADVMWCSLVTNSRGETRFVGSSSGLSIFSPKGVQWVNEKTGDSSFQEMIGELSADDNKWFPWREEIFGDIFARRTFKALPPRKECFAMVSEFFQNFNQTFPLYHEPTFMHLLDRQYSDNPYEGSGWWASLNVVLAICHRLRVVSKVASDSEDAHGWAYIKNSMAVLAELTLRNTDLLSVSALIGMSMYLMGTPNPQPSFYLIGAALRLAQSIGLHKQTSGLWLNTAEVEQRKRVFWMAYQMDKDMCLRSGRPPAQDEDDWNVDLPSENPEDDLGTIPLSDGIKKFNIFRTMCSFAVISSKVYNRLYSVKAARQSDGELLNTIGELDAELEEWKDTLPTELRPDNEIGNLPLTRILHVVHIHFAYYNCLTTIHRRSVHHGYWSSRLSDYAVRGLNVKPLNPRVFSSAALCVSAARTSIHLLKHIPQGDIPVVWVLIYYPISALVTLFANILQNPQDARARSDLRLMNLVVTFLADTKAADGTGSMQRMYSVCRGFEHIARVVLDRTEKDMTARQRKKQEKEREKYEKSSTAEQYPRKSQDLKRPAEAYSRSQLGKLNEPGSDLGRRSSPSSNANVYTPDVFSASDFSPSDSVYNPLLNSQYADNNNNNNDGNATNAGAMDGSNRGVDFNVGSWANANQPSAMHPQNQQHVGADEAVPTGEFSSPTVGNFGSDFMQDSMYGANAFQQPFVPQELWQIPMTFEWDWAGMSGNPFDPSGMGIGMGPVPGGAENGVMMDSTFGGMAEDLGMGQNNNQRHQ